MTINLSLVFHTPCMNVYRKQSANVKINKINLRETTNIYPSSRTIKYLDHMK